MGDDETKPWDAPDPTKLRASNTPAPARDREPARAEPTTSPPPRRPRSAERRSGLLNYPAPPAPEVLGRAPPPSDAPPPVVAQLERAGIHIDGPVRVHTDALPPVRAVVSPSPMVEATPPPQPSSVLEEQVDDDLERWSTSAPAEQEPVTSQREVSAPIVGANLGPWWFVFSLLCAGLFSAIVLIVLAWLTAQTPASSVEVEPPRASTSATTQEPSPAPATPGAPASQHRETLPAPPPAPEPLPKPKPATAPVPEPVKPKPPPPATLRSKPPSATVRPKTPSPAPEEASPWGERVETESSGDVWGPTE